MKFILSMICLSFMLSQNLTTADFTYKSKANAYFRKDVSKNVIKRVYNQLAKKKEMVNKKGRLRTAPSLIGGVVKQPNWTTYNGPTVATNVSFRLRIGKKGKPDIIILKTDAPKEAYKIIINELLKANFNPGISNKKGKPVRSWMSLSEYYKNY